MYADRLIHLWGNATSTSGRTIEDGAYEWSIDGKPAGRGSDLWVENPGKGRHELRLTVRDGELEGTAELAFEVIGDAAEIG